MATFSTFGKRIPNKVVSEPTFIGGTLTVKEGIRSVKEGIRAFHLQSNLLEKRLDSLNEEFEVRMTKLEEKFDAMMSILQQSNPQLLIVPQIPIIHPQPSKPHTTALISTAPLFLIAPQQVERREVTNPNSNSFNSKGCCDGGNVFRAQINDGVVVNGEDLLSFKAKVKSVEKNGDETFKVFVEMHKQENEEKLMIEVSTIFASIPNHLPSVCGNVSKAFVPYLEPRLSFQRNVKRAEFEALKGVVGSDKIVLDGWPPPICENVAGAKFLATLDREKNLLLSLFRKHSTNITSLTAHEMSYTSSSSVIPSTHLCIVSNTKCQTFSEISSQQYPTNTDVNFARINCVGNGKTREALDEETYNKLDVIGIDEAQFFEDLYDFCCSAADRDGKTVIVAGLDGDYLRRRFGSVLDIIPLADSGTKLTTRCELCGRPAFFTLRKTGETKTELIGGADVYMPVCRQHYVNGHVVMGTARLVLESMKEELEFLSEVAVPLSS